MNTTLEWTAPGPGTWELAADHYPRPITAAMQPFASVWSEVSTEWMLDIGLPIKSAEMRTVNGLPYVCIDDGSGGRKPPPPIVMRLAVKLMPSMRRAERRLATLIRDRPWVDGVASWYGADRSDAIERMRRIARVDLRALDDHQLVEHLESVSAELFDSAAEHLRMHAHDTFPPGLFAVTAVDAGLSRDEALALLTGSSPASTGQSDELLALRRAVAGRTATSVDELRALGADVADALDTYLLEHGGRVVDGYDLDSVTLGEQPSLVLALACAPVVPPEDRSGLLEAARSRVAAEQLTTFDRQLADARATYGARDDNSGILIAWPAGLLRLAMLEAGRRLVDKGLVDEPALAVEATIGELRSALLDGVVDDGALTSRRRHRHAVSASEAPRHLGPAPVAAPEGLTGALGLVMRIFSMFDMAVANDSSSAGLRGMGIGDRSYSGIARVVRAGSDSLDRFEPGDVLVAPMTSPSYNVLLSLAGAVVTEEGAVMSHAAIMARELGLPAVLGVGGATSSIADGDTVTVDPVAGTVTVVVVGESREG